MIKENKSGKKFDKKEKLYTSPSQKSIISKGKLDIRQQLEDNKKKKMMKEKLERFRPNNNFKNNNINLSNANKKIIQLLSGFMEVYKLEEKKDNKNKYLIIPQDINHEIRKNPSGINGPISHIKILGSKKPLFNRALSYKKKPNTDASNSCDNLLNFSLKNSVKPGSTNYNLNQNFNNTKIIKTDRSSPVKLVREKPKQNHVFSVPYLSPHKKNEDIIKSDFNDNSILSKNRDKILSKNYKRFNNDSENNDIQLNKNLLNSSISKKLFNPLGCKTIESLEKETVKEFESGCRTNSYNSSSKSNNEFFPRIRSLNSFTRKKNLIRARTASSNKRKGFQSTICAISNKKICGSKKTIANFNLKYKFDLISEDTEVIDHNDNSLGISSIINRIKKANKNKYKTKEKDVIFLSRIQQKIKQSIIGLDKEDFRQFRKEMKENENNEITNVINNLPTKKSSNDNDLNKKHLSKIDISIKSKSSKDSNLINVDTIKENSVSNIDIYNESKKKIFEIKYRSLQKRKYVYDSLDDEEIEEDEFDILYINPHSAFIYLLDFCVGISALISLFYIPFYLSYNQQFCKKFNEPSEIILLMVDIIYIFDLVIGFFKAYYNFDEYLIRKTTSICINYLKTWFVLDFLLAFPIFSLFIFKLPKCNIEKINNVMDSHFYEMNMNKLHLLFLPIKSLKIFKVFISSNSFRKFFIRFLQLDFINKWHKSIIYFFIAFSIIHFCCCLFIFIGRNTDPNWIMVYNLPNEKYRDIYIFSFYFVMTTITTVGYGDVIGYNFHEKIFQCLILISGTIAYSWIVSSLSNYIKKENEKTIEYEKRVKILEEIKLTNPHLKQNLYERISRYLYYRQYNEKHDRNLILDNLPISLRNSLVIEMYKPIVNKFIFFKNFQNADFIVRVILAFRPILAVKGDLLVQEGEFIEDIIFVKQGVLSLEISIDLNNPEKSVQAYLKGKNLEKHNGKKLNKNIELLENKPNFNNIVENNENEKMLFDQRVNSIFQNKETLKEINNNIRNIRIIDIRKNEHFGDILMFLNERSPLYVKVKSKKTELFFLKKTDAIEILSSYPNIWKRINMKSLYNMEQIKNLIRKVLLIFCNIHGIKTKVGKKKRNSKNNIFNDEDLKNLSSLERTKTSHKANGFRSFDTQDNINSVIYEETNEDKDIFEKSLRVKTKKSEYKSSKKIKHTKSSVIKNKLKAEIDTFKNDGDNSLVLLENNILKTVGDFRNNKNEIKGIINNTNNFYLNVNYNNNIDHHTQNTLTINLNSLNIDSNISKQCATSYSGNIKSKVNNIQQSQYHLSSIKDKDLSPKSNQLYRSNKKIKSNHNSKNLKKSNKKSNDDAINSNLLDQTEKCEIDNKPISISESDLQFSDNDKNNNIFLERFNIDKVNEEFHSSDEIISGLNIKTSLLNVTPKKDINDDKMLSKRILENIWFKKLKKQSKKFLCDYINDINIIKYKNYRIQQITSFELESCYDNINQVTNNQYIKDNGLQVKTKNFLRNECNINKNKENRLSLKWTKNKNKNKNNNLLLSPSIHNLKKIKTNQVLSPFKKEKKSIISKESLVRVPSEGDLINQFLSLKKPTLSKVKGLSKNFDTSSLTKHENQKSKKLHQTTKNNLQTFKSKNNLSSDKSSSMVHDNKNVDHQRSIIYDSLCKKEVENEPNFYTKMKTIDKRLNFSKTNKFERKFKKQNNNGLLARLTQNMREDSTNLKNPEEYFNELFENIYTKQMNALNNRKDTKNKDTYISEKPDDKIKRNKTYFKSDNLKSLKRNVFSIKNIGLSFSRIKKHKYCEDLINTNTKT